MKKSTILLTLALCLGALAIFSVPLMTFGFIQGDAENDGVSISKYVTVTTTENAETGETDYSYTLDLEVFTTGVVTSTSTETTPADIVLVLDQSTSMIWPADQAEDNALADGNIGIVDGSYSYDYDASINENEGGYVLSWTYENTTVTPLYGIWAADDASDYGDLETDTTRVNGVTYYTVEIGSGNSSQTYTWGEDYTLSFEKDVVDKNENTIYYYDLEDGWSEEYIAVFGYLYSESRQSDLIEAVVEFIFELYTKAGHRVSIVTYHNTSITEYSLTGTANTTTDGIYDYTDIVDEVLSWVDTVNADGVSADGYATGTNPSNLSESSSNSGGVHTFNLQHSTLISLGVEDAEDILFDAKYTGNNTQSGLEDLYIDSGRTQLSVIFTDGIPTQISSSGNTGSSTSTLYNVERALEASYNMKQDGVTVFTIGMLDGVYSDYSKNATTNSSSDYYCDYTTNNGKKLYITDGDTFISSFLDLLSSNYINADEYISDDGFPNSSKLYENDGTNSTDYQIDTTFNKNTTEVTNEDGTTSTEYTEFYYPIDTSTGDVNIAETLNDIFVTVAGMMEGYAEFELDQTTQIRDVMTAEYNIPVNFDKVTDGSGDYDYNSATDTYYYVETGGAYKIDVDISVYIAYCTGENSPSADNYSDNIYDDGYYTWGESVLVYDTTNGSTAKINDDVYIVVRNIYIDITKDSDGNYLYGDYVYYYDSVQWIDETDTYYLVNSNGEYIDHEGNITNTPIILYPSQQVIVQGFNFNNYYVTTVDKSSDNSNDYGAKLIIEFDIEYDTVSDSDETATGGATIGGNEIETNMSSSGVYLYSNDETSGDMGYNSLESFPVPQADIPLDVDLVIGDQTIYLGNAVSVVDLVTIDGHTVQGVANAYVEIAYTLYSATEIDKSAYDKLGDDEGFTKEEISTDDSTITKYYKYTTGNSEGDIVYSAVIEAGQSATDANGLYVGETLITPQEDTNYIVEITVTPVIEGTIEAETYYEVFSVYVLYPEVSANDIWVDYATPVNLRDDNIYQITDENGTYSTFDNIRVSWNSVSSYDIVIPEPNNAIPPTVTFGFTARRGIEYTAAEFEEYGIREDKEFEITSMTVTSSDGYNTVTYFDLDEYDEADTTTFEVNVNRFDLELYKTVDADLYDIYPQSFIFDIGYVGSEFTVAQKHVENTDGYVVFVYDDPNTGIVSDDQLSVNTAGFYDGETAFAIYSKNGIDITASFFDEDGNYLTSGDNYIVWSDDYYYIVYDGNTYHSQLLYESDGVTPVYETVAISDIYKDIEVVIDPDMSKVTTTEWTDSDGNRYYTFTATITELYCGIEMTVTEETDWSWRYEPGFTISTIASENATVTESENSDGSTTQEIRETITSYKMADFDEVYSGDYELGEYDIGTDYDYYLLKYTFDTVSYVTTADDKSYAVILVENSENYLDKNGSNTDYSSWERITETVYFGPEIYYATNVSFNVSAGTITYTPNENSSYSNMDTVTITTKADEDISTDCILYEIYYYDNDYNKVYEIQVEDGELTPQTYYVTTATEMTDNSGNVVTDTDGNIVYEYSEGYAFQIIEIAKSVPAVDFEAIDVHLDVYNSIDEEQWLSYSALNENFYDPLDDPRT